jgi:hypothetical protein
MFKRTFSSGHSTSGRVSNTRQVQLKLFQWPSETSSGFLVVLQYDFSGVNPSPCCWSIGRLAHLAKSGGKLELRDEILLQTAHHLGIERAELLDLTGYGVATLLIQSDFGGAGTSGSSLQVFDLSHGSFEELLNVNSRLEYMTEEGYTQVLDVSRTRETHGQQFCVVKTTLFEQGLWFRHPRITRECYKRGSGINAEDVSFRRKLLAPLP